MNVAALFDFSSIAVIGASPRNDIAVSTLKGMQGIGYTGKVACIHPSAEPLLGYPAFASLDDVPFPIDHAVIDIRADRVTAELERCARRGVKAATIHSGGFAEAGPEGIARQGEITAIAVRAGMAICGPNCMGLLSVHDRTAAYCKTELPDLAGGVGVIAHSGGVLNEVLNYGSYRGIRFSKAVSAGNEAVCTVADFLEHLVDDPDTTTIGLVLEGIRSPQRLRAALAVALERNKPVVAIKIGSSKLAAAAAAMHTGAVVGSAEVFAALCAQYGVTLVRDIDQMCEAMLVFSNAVTMLRAQREPRGVAVIEISGGGGELVCDIAERVALELAPLSAATERALAGVLSAPSNPVDLSGSWMDPESLPRHEAALQALAADGGFDVVISRLTVPPHGDIPMLLAHGAILDAAARAHPEMLFAGLSRVPDAINPQWRAFVAERGLVYAQGYERGLGAIAQLLQYLRFLAQPPGAAPAIERVTASGGVLGDKALVHMGFPVDRTAAAHGFPTASLRGYRDEVYGAAVACTIGETRVLRLAPIDARSARNSLAAAGIGGIDTSGLAEIMSRLSAWMAVDDRLAEVIFDPVVLCPTRAVIAAAQIVLL